MNIVTTLNIAQLSAYRRSLLDAEPTYNGRPISELSQSETMTALKDSLIRIANYQERFGSPQGV